MRGLTLTAYCSARQMDWGRVLDPFSRQRQRRRHSDHQRRLQVLHALSSHRARHLVHTSRRSVALWGLPSPQVPGAGDMQDGGLTDLQPLCRHAMLDDQTSLLAPPLDLTAPQVARG
jgi:hypothetical protein